MLILQVISLIRERLCVSLSGHDNHIHFERIAAVPTLNS
ncbi:hypothetical protein GXM_06484 [Nostoc sphaeroides CCNUC1]|uniref:Uncharacterized protein n=1 Tax=Nostoc sphaeroides CCNUC1 TaxID=2653204 RepID=A0A5P8W8K2_9NOSO|nr:hypothetical protein GXM_06484 [Nostoc sphaeroides CCNUC1]